MRMKTYLISGVAMLFATILSGQAQSPSVLHTFGSTTSDGYSSEADLALSGNVLYGTTQLGGTNDYGVIFSVNTDGTGYTILHSFTGGPDGGVPDKDLLVCDGIIYGTAHGTNMPYGEIFSMQTNGNNFNVVYTFTANTDGALGNPNGGLILCDGVFYGTAYQGGITNAGSIFSVSTNGTFHLLHLFQADTDGENPLGLLVLSDGVLYGTTRNGGTNGEVVGTVYSIGTNGDNFTVLHMFGRGTNDVRNSDAGLVLSGDTLYGTGIDGGMYGRGGVFFITTNGSDYGVVHSFNPATEGFIAQTGLALSGNTLYGTTIAYGDSDLSGTVYSVNTDGSSFTTLYTASPPPGGIGGTNSDGAEFSGALAMAGNVLYGTSVLGGADGEGTVYSLAVVPAISTLGIVGTNLTLNGFNGIEGETCTTLSSTNLTLPLGLWTPLATNTLSSGGDFTITVTNGVNPAVASQFYTLQTTVP